MPKRSFPEEPKIINNNPSEEYIISPYNDRFELRWKVPADNGEPIDYYDIKCCVVSIVSNYSFTHIYKLTKLFFMYHFYNRLAVGRNEINLDVT